VRQVPATAPVPEGGVSSQATPAALALHASIWPCAGEQRRVPAASVLAATAEESALEVALVLFEACPQAAAVIVTTATAASINLGAVRVIVPHVAGG
jgi:hypothetical protein